MSFFGSATQSLVLLREIGGGGLRVSFLMLEFLNVDTSCRARLPRVLQLFMHAIPVSLGISWAKAFSHLVLNVRKYYLQQHEDQSQFTIFQTQADIV